MLVVNTENLGEQKYKPIKLVTGSVVQSKNVGRDIMASFKTLIGGEIVSYTEMMNEARATAEKRMLAKATELQADAIVNVRYASSAIMQGTSEVIVYGTAVKFI